MDEHQALFSQALSSHTRGEISAAESLYQQILQQNHHHIGSLINLASIFRNRGQFQPAIQFYQKATFLDPNNAFAHYQLAVTFHDSGNLVAAVQSYKKALALEPFKVTYLYELGNTLLKLEQFDEAMFCFKHVIKLSPDSTNPYLKLGKIHLQRGEFDSAITCFQEIIKKKPEFPGAYIAIGMVYTRQNHLLEAKEYFNQALKLEANNQLTQTWLSLVEFLIAGYSTVTFTYKEQRITFCITGNNLGIELSQIQGKFYEQNELEFLANRLNHPKTIIDIGCNTGNHLVYFAKFLQPNKIIPIEFHPKAIALLKKNLHLNQITTVDLSKMGYAVNQTRGKALLKEHPAQDIALTQLYETPEGSIEIFPLDELINEPIDLIKIDVEGIELEVLEGSFNLLSAYHPDLLIEIRKLNQQQVFRYLKNLGYQVRKIFDYGSYINAYFENDI